MTKQGALRTGIQMQACQSLVSGFPRLWSWSGKLTGVSCEGLGRRRGARQADQWELGHLFFASPDSLSTLFTLVKVNTQRMNRGLPALQLLGARARRRTRPGLFPPGPSTGSQWVGGISPSATRSRFQKPLPHFLLL